jgi:hypothetical protein
VVGVLALGGRAEEGTGVKVRNRECTRMAANGRVYREGREGMCLVRGAWCLVADAGGMVAGARW